ncbi:hypothetical protein BD779DRAFT_1683540 [Infundibulicybe gibba]|nr:hypothetical protein BD779DRAFT_1683540 [Infundibulicybe gibba]
MPHSDNTYFSYPFQYYPLPDTHYVVYPPPPPAGPPLPTVPLPSPTILVPPAVPIPSSSPRPFTPLAFNDALPLPSSSDTVPSIGSLTYIPILTGCSNWGPWSDAVAAAIKTHGLTRHICDDPPNGAPYDPWHVPLYPPTVSRDSSPQEIAAFELWWRRDGAAFHILVS